MPTQDQPMADPAKQRQWSTRRASPEDCAGIRSLFELSKKGGMARTGDPADDLHNIQDFYETSDDLGRFWVVEDSTQTIVGMIGVLPEQEHVAAVRRLHVHPERRQQGIGSCLMSTALQHCHDNGFVKIHLETDEYQTAAMALFTRFGFRLDRTRDRENRKIMEFYIDLYSSSEGHD